MLAVDGKEAAAAAPPRLDRELAAGTQALLGRERQVDTVLERPERGREALEADDRVQDDVRPGAVEQLGDVAADLNVLDAVLGCDGI